MTVISIIMSSSDLVDLPCIRLDWDLSLLDYEDFAAAQLVP